MPSPSPSEPASSTSGSAGDVDLRRRLVAQDRFLEALVGSLRAVASGLDGRGVLERATQQAHAMFGPDATVMVAPSLGEDTLRPVAAAGVALGPLADVTIEAGAPGSPIAIAARDLAPASAQVAGSEADGLLCHLRPAAVLAAPLSVAGRLHARAGAARPGLGPRVRRRRRLPGRAVRRLRRPGRRQRRAVRPGRRAAVAGPHARGRAGRALPPGDQRRAGGAAAPVGVPPRRAGADAVRAWA